MRNLHKNPWLPTWGRVNLEKVVVVQTVSLSGIHTFTKQVCDVPSLCHF